jgi:hypothetical protein
VNQPQQYRHPGQVFISRYGLPASDRSVLQYVEFLRQEAGLNDSPPIDLSAIYRHFGMPTPLRAPLADQQGILVDSDAGVILIKEDDPIVRQRFTEGHELMELLFDAQERFFSETQAKPSWNEQRKEQLCDQGAAELLMPQSSFVPKLHELGLSFQTGRTLANLYQTSLLATLVRMLQYSSGGCALVMWHCAFSRRESETLNISTAKPQKKLRVWWRTTTRSWSCGFIPKNKSVSPDSLISYAYTSGQCQKGTETLNLGRGSFQCQVEAMPMQIGDKYCVLSLLHFLNSFL